MRDVRKHQPLSTELPALLLDHTPGASWDHVREAIARTAVGIHLAILQQPYLDMLLEGTKTIESRFSLRRIPPWGRTAVGDLVLLKLSGGPVFGSFTAADVTCLAQQGSPPYWGHEQQVYGPTVGADEAFWHSVSSKPYATFIAVGNVQPVEPCFVARQGQSAWAVCREVTGQTELPIGTQLG